jgi:hypothetical protein
MRFLGSGRARWAAPITIVIGLAAGALLPARAPARTQATVVVPRDFPTIQAAVDAAAPGDTITVRSGTYTEEVVIAKDINLREAGVGATVIKSPATLTPYAVDTRNGTQFTAIVRIAHGARVRISGLTVSGPLPCQFVFGIVAVQSANLELTDARVSDMQPEPGVCPVRSSALVAVAVRFLLDGWSYLSHSCRLRAETCDALSPLSRLRTAARKGQA